MSKLCRFNKEHHIQYGICLEHEKDAILCDIGVGALRREIAEKDARLKEAKDFYVNVLSCSACRETDAWVYFCSRHSKMFTALWRQSLTACVPAKESGEMARETDEEVSKLRWEIAELREALTDCLTWFNSKPVRGAFIIAALHGPVSQEIADYGQRMWDRVRELMAAEEGKNG